MSPVHCGNDPRRDRVRAHAENGLDYVEVALTDEHGRRLSQPVLSVFFLGKAPADPITAANVRLEGGRRIAAADIRIVDVEVVRQKDPELDDTLLVTVSQAGDWSPYTLRLVEAEDGYPTEREFPGFDQRYGRVTFSFTAGCATDLDCQTPPVCPPVVREEPEISYLAKDYASFRQLILDRLSLVMPEWRERHVPDIEIALVELLAYVGDYLSYQQDAVATEAYLATARQRISVRRHARLVDYAMHEGCNARAWIAIDTAGDVSLARDDVFFVTGHNDALAVSGTVLTVGDLSRVPRGTYEVFEPLRDRTGTTIDLYFAHNTIRFYTWGSDVRCIEKDATSATLRDSFVDAPKPPDPKTTARKQAVQAVAPAPQRALHLKPGDVLLFEEVIGPKTGDTADADPRHRHAVRLTKVEPGVDLLFTPPVPIVTVEWAPEDRLPFPLCLTAVPDIPGCPVLCDITVAHGNVVLVDHGERVDDEPLGVVDVVQTQRCECDGEAADPVSRTVPLTPVLKKSPVTFAQELVPMTPAARVLGQDPRLAMPEVHVIAVPAIETESGELVPLVDVAELDDPARAAALVQELRTPADARYRFLRALLPSALAQAIDALNPAAPPPATVVRQVALAIAAVWETWTVVRDLLESTGDDRDVVVEIDNEQRAHLRFGDGDLGHAPAPGSTFVASYRVGNGAAGNVGAEAISRVVFRRTFDDAIQRVRNPLAAQGGIEPELVDDVRLLAPTALRQDIQRAVTAEDYAALALRDFADAVQRAAGTLQWTGSWYEAHVAIDPLGTDQEQRGLERAIDHRLSRYRRIGHDLAVRPAEYVPLDIELTVCVEPHYLRGHVEGDLLAVFSNQRLPDGRLGFFHPDRLTFGDDIFLSALVAVAQAVTGVASVQVTRLQRRFNVADDEIENGVLELGPAEIAQVDNDPNFPEHGRFALVMKGGR